CLLLCSLSCNASVHLCFISIHTSTTVIYTLSLHDALPIFCTKKGILHITVAPQDFELLSGEGEMTTYRFNTGTAQHTFCTTCGIDRKSTRLNSSHQIISYAVFCLKKKKKKHKRPQQTQNTR